MNDDLSGTILAKRPPGATLFKAFVYLNLAWPSAFLIYVMLTGKNSIMNKPGGNVGVGVGIMAVFGVFALWMLFLMVRILSRWFLKRAEIVETPESVRFGIPRRNGWWNPFLTVDEKEVPKTELKESRFEDDLRAPLVIETGSGEIRIPSGMFSVGGYTLDERLRKAMSGTGRMIPVTPIGHWSAGTGMRILIIIAMVLSIVAFMALAILQGTSEASRRSSDGGLFKVPGMILMILMIGFIALLFVFRGRVAVDVRGFFYERNGSVSFVSWEMLKSGSVTLKSESLSLGTFWQLEIRSAGTLIKKPKFRMSLTRIMGLGWPLGKIEEVVQKCRAAADRMGG